MRKIALFAAVLAMAALIGVTVLYSSLRGDADRFAACRESRIAGGAGAIGGPFELVSETGETVTEAEVLAQPSLVYFGYTFCPDICPVDVARNASAVDLLAEEGYDVTPVFVSVDPARDTPEVLASYTDALHPDMIGLTGSPEQVDAAEAAYKVYSRVPADPEDDFYIVDHTTMTYLMLPDSGFQELFRREASAEQMADTVACFIDRT